MTERASTPPSTKSPGAVVSSLANATDAHDEPEEPTTPVRRPSGLSEENQQTREQLKAIHEELDLLRKRREELEQRRRSLLAASAPPLPTRTRGGGARTQSSSLFEPSVLSSQATHAQTPRSHARAASHVGLPSPISLAQSNYMYPTSSSLLRGANSHTHGRRSGGVSVSSRASSTERVHVSHASAQAAPILSEQERRSRLRETPYLLVKNSMREAAKVDSALVMGDFLLEDQPRVYTFGRERRFMPIVGQGGSYYLATDVAIAQDEARAASAHRSRSTHRDVSGPPGPGAYTPRYSKVSKPSPRASMMW